MRIAVGVALQARAGELVYGFVTQETVGTASTGGATHATHVHVCVRGRMREGWLFVKMPSQAKEVSFPKKGPSGEDLHHSFSWGHNLELQFSMLIEEYCR